MVRPTSIIFFDITVEAAAVHSKSHPHSEGHTRVETHVHRAELSRLQVSRVETCSKRWGSNV